MQSKTDKSQDSNATPDATLTPSKRRRGGRRACNPELSAEERKRLRVLKNRESAMKSLLKKAQYSESLEKCESDNVAEYNNNIANLEQMLASASRLRALLDNQPSVPPSIFSSIENAIASAQTTLKDIPRRNV